MDWITGAGILERPGWGLKAELANAFKAGLRPFRDADGTLLMACIKRDGKFVDMGSRCFHCTRGSKDRGYMATGCPWSDVGQDIDLIIQKIIKPGIEELRGKVDKALFSDGLPSNVFDFPGYSADADFVQFVEDQVGPDNLRAMLIESRCKRQEPADQNEICNRLLAAKFRLEAVQAFEDLHGIGSTTQPKVKTKDRRREIIAIPTKPGTTWPQIKIRIVNNTRLEITVHGYDMAPYDPKALGINPARQGDVTMWAILTLFAKWDGSLPPASKDTVIGKSNITNFRKLLKRIFPDIEGDPVKRWHRKGGYQCEFEISINDYYSNANSNAPDIEEQDGDYTDLIANRRS